MIYELVKIAGRDIHVYVFEPIFAIQPDGTVKVCVHDTFEEDCAEVYFRRGHDHIKIYWSKQLSFERNAPVNKERNHPKLD